MKTINLFTFLILYGFNIFAQQQISNGNFETWTNNEAPPWHSSFNLGATIYTAQQSNDSYQGSSSAKLTSQSLFGQFVPGLITLGNLDILNQSLKGGIPYTDRPDGIGFFFKYIPSGIDTMFLGAFLTKWNETTLTTDTVGITGYLNSDTYNNYTEINLPFIYNLPDLPDTLNMIFTSSSFNGNAGSTLFLDSISMKNGTIISPTFCFPADEITSSGFKAHWMTIPNATGYILDVSGNQDFSNYITGYENLNTGLDTFYVVNVSPGTYFYRVRVNYDTETSINSNTVEVSVESTEVKNQVLESIKILTLQNNLLITNTETVINSVKVYNTEGKEVFSKETKDTQVQIFLNTPGIYILVLKTDSGIFRKKIAVIF